jgi:AAA domain
MTQIGQTVLSPHKTASVNTVLHVRTRLDQLAQWKGEWEAEDSQLMQRLTQLDHEKPIDREQGLQIANLRRRLRMKQIAEPVELTGEMVDKGFAQLRSEFVAQFAHLSDHERLLWLNNFLFIMAPDLRRLDNKIASIRSYSSLGQERDFLLGGESGMGKTTFLDWLCYLHLQTVQPGHNFVPIVKIDAPVNNKSPRALFRRMILEYGKTYSSTLDEETLLEMLILLVAQCSTEVIIIDEVEHLVRHEMRRRLLEISNLGKGVKFICASCRPREFTQGDAEIEGRWNDDFVLEPYTGKRLEQLLSFIDLLLPFTKESYLYRRELKTGPKPGERTEGPANLIEKWTGGILRDIMILIVDASRTAIRNNLPNLSTTLLEDTWKNIQTRAVVDYSKRLNGTVQNR